MTGRSSDPEPSTVIAWYTVGVLTLIYTFSYVDRQILTLLFEPIKRDLQISDTKISLLSGIAFAGLYALLGIPISRLADRKNRVAIIAVGMVLWSTMTAASGFARTFGELFLARVCVGIGEATLSPSAYSIIADSFAPHKLGRAVGVYSLAIYLGMGAALLFGSFVVALVQGLPSIPVPLVGVMQSWRIALMCVGLPGLVFALLLTTVREPNRRGAIASNPATAALNFPGDIDSVFRYLAKHWRVYVPHFAGFSLMGMFGNGLATWVPEFFRRSHGWPVQRTGIAFGVIMLCCGAPGVLVGGWYADRRSAAGIRDAPIRVAILAIIPLGLCGVIMPLVSSPALALVLLGVIVFCFSLPGGLAPASLQIVTPNRMRARVSAVFLFCTTLVGQGLGPTLVAAISDFAFSSDAALGHALSIVAAGVTPISIAAFVYLLRPYRAAAAAACAWK